MPPSKTGSYVNTYLVVSVIEPAHQDLKDRGIPVSHVFQMERAGADARNRSESR